MTIFTAQKKKRKMFFSPATSSESVKCPEQNVLSPARVTDSLSSYQIRPLHLPSWTYSLTAQFFFQSFTLFSASKFNTLLRSEKEQNRLRKKEQKKENFHESPSLLQLSISVLLPHSSSVSDFSKDSSSFSLAPLQQLSGRFHSDAT